MYKISSENLNGREIQDLIDRVEEYYKQAKDGDWVSFEVKIRLLNEHEKTDYPQIRDVKIVNKF